ncbi:unnamed protein product [Effrenium voratum]|nr:unnamed protein product [Effrenium voratum]
MQNRPLFRRVKRARRVAGATSLTSPQGGDKDISGGPVKNRHCTDLLCLILFIVHWGAFCAVIFVGMQDGEPAKLYQPRDFKGDYCDLGSLVGATKLLRTLNVSATVDEVAKQLICSTAAENALSGVMTTAQMDEYRCACCKMPCANCESNLGLEDLQDGLGEGSLGGIGMSEFTDPTKAATLFSSGSANAMSFSAEDVFGEMTKFMVATCLNQTSCAAPTVNTTTSGARSYVYSPTPTEPWKFAWDVLASNAGIPADIKEPFWGPDLWVVSKQGTLQVGGLGDQVPQQLVDYVLFRRF